MNKSANFNFNLPSSANEEIADIDVISDNFRIIDGVMNETAQYYDPTSAKAQSGKAVAEAIASVQPITEETEFIFDGGDAETAAEVDIIVDSALSATSANAIMNKAVTAAINELKESISTEKNDMLLSVYPVGAIYISTAPTDPATLFGGTWEQIEDRFLLACGGTYPAGDTGGEADVTLTVEEMPTHSHQTGTNGGHLLWGGDARVGNIDNSANGYWTPVTESQTSAVGGNTAHNNMPPYIAVYVWQRKA